eukprot:TRINITY_DN9747_c1_g1_i15.p1 TRINITY_DN9747_c1_g1~~TRINITY_DN9747_c1_g1_i15.p1  ORF type:complete len:286 (+),score=54.67 TRINITY_DN9747_c1_g1_i15:153-1010(+)
MDHAVGSFTESRRKPLSLSFLHFRDGDAEDAEDAPAPKGVLLPLSFIGSMKRRHSFAGFVRYEVCEALQSPDEHTGNLLEQKMLDGLKDEAAAIATRKQSADLAKAAASGANQRLESYAGKAGIPAKVGIQPKSSASLASASAAQPFLADKLRMIDAQTAVREEDGELTLMIRNLPKYLDQTTLIESLCSFGFGGKFNFCWLPSNLANTTECMGYAFINFARGSDAKRFRIQWNRQYNQLSIQYAEIQGIDANLKRLEQPSLKRIKNPALRPWVATESLVPETKH